VIRVSWSAFSSEQSIFSDFSDSLKSAVFRRFSVIGF